MAPPGRKGPTMHTTTHLRAGAGSSMDPNGDGAGLDPHGGG